MGGALSTNCAKPTAAERENLAMWIACEKKRPFVATDAGVDAP
jgi:hypothetical protein